MINIHQLTMRFGRQTAVSDLSIWIGAGESVALWGTNGAGKSTILRCITGALRYRGQITIGGVDARRKGKQARQLIGYVPQELGFYDDLRVGAAIRYFGALKAMASVSVDETLERVGLSGQQGKRIRELSGGMKQRLALAIALINDPPILLLDEVTASLDAVGRHELIELLTQVRQSGTQRTILFASHRLEEIQALATRVVTLEKGTLIRDEPAASFAERSSETLLHLIMPLAAAHRSVEVLQSRGVAARLNGCGILVPTTAGHRADAVRLLAEHGVQVDDFELLSNRMAGGVQ